MKRKTNYLDNNPFSVWKTDAHKLNTLGQVPWLASASWPRFSEVVWVYGSTLSLTSAQNWQRWDRPQPPTETEERRPQDLMFGMWVSEADFTGNKADFSLLNSILSTLHEVCSADTNFLNPYNYLHSWAWGCPWKRYLQGHNCDWGLGVEPLYLLPLLKAKLLRFLRTPVLVFSLAAFMM